MGIKHVISMVLGIGVCATAAAQPGGSFYLFKNKFNGNTLCMQSPISPDWILDSGPFLDERCQVPKPPEGPRRKDLPANPLDLYPKKPSSSS